mgnify:CR=1 FL=1
MVCMPLFGDQYDNAQRLQETGLGARVDPYGFTAEQLSNAVERVLKDEQMQEKMRNAAVRIRQSNRHELLAVQVEELVRNETK